MLDKIKSVAGNVAGTIKSLPPVIRYPVYALIAVGLPTMGFFVVIGGTTIGVILGPVVLAVLLVWIAAQYLG